jgi:hypothetical protein
MTIDEKIEAHNRTVEDAARIINRLFGEHRYFNSIEMTEENRHDGKVTIVLSLTEIKGGDE